MYKKNKIYKCVIRDIVYQYTAMPIIYKYLIVVLSALQFNF